MTMSAEAAAELYAYLRRGGVSCWVMGGWGVDALMRRQTREHHDLDVLILVDDLRRLRRLLDERGFEIALVWEEENRWLDLDGDTYPTAFVASDDGGAELDVHVIELSDDATVVTLCNVPWPFVAGSLEGRGAINGTPVSCVSALTQLDMHQGYALPEPHNRDVLQLQRLV